MGSDRITHAAGPKVGDLRPPATGSVASLSFTGSIPPKKVSADYWPASMEELARVVASLGGYSAFVLNGYGLHQEIEGGEVNVFIAHVPSVTPVSELDRYLKEKIEEARDDAEVAA